MSDRGVSSFSFLSNLKKLSELSDVDVHLMPSFNYSDPSSVTPELYRTWFGLIGKNISGNFTDCDLEKEMQQVDVGFLGCRACSLVGGFCVLSRSACLR